MTRPRGELTTLRARGGHATDPMMVGRVLFMRLEKSINTNEYIQRLISHVTLPAVFAVMGHINHLNVHTNHQFVHNLFYTPHWLFLTLPFLESKFILKDIKRLMSK